MGNSRPLRVDAQANRVRILDVAEEVARLAGVGIATVFRHFPTKAALLEAVLVRRFDRLRAEAEALLDAADPGAAFTGFFGRLVADAATKIAIGEALADAGGADDGPAGAASTGLRRAVGALLRRAQQAGAVRDDAELPEVYALLVGVSRLRLDEEVRARALAIIHDGLAAR